MTHQKKKQLQMKSRPLSSRVMLHVSCIAILNDQKSSATQVQTVMCGTAPSSCVTEETKKKCTICYWTMHFPYVSSVTHEDGDRRQRVLFLLKLHNNSTRKLIPRFFLITALHLVDQRATTPLPGFHKTHQYYTRQHAMHHIGPVLLRA